MKIITIIIIVSVIQTPEIIKTFKEYLLLILIEYFKNEMILLNNIIELSKCIVLKDDDLKNLITILVTDSDVNYPIHLRFVNLVVLKSQFIRRYNQ
jgi:hypothetical protein